MFHQSGILFIAVLLMFFVWISLVYKNGVKKMYFLYFLLNFLMFFGPLFYYSLGFVAYSNVVSEDSLNTYSIISFFVVLLNIFFFKRLNNSTNHFGLRPFFLKYKLGLFQKRNLKSYYLFFLGITTLYVIVFFSNFPLVLLITSGKLGERLDVSGAIPFYITFSAISMIFIPSAFFYFKTVIKNKLILITLFLFTIFLLTAGGNKGIVSFFLIFYVLIGTDKLKMINILIVTISLVLIYLITKGITTFNSETISFLIESPFRRLFAAQGVGFVGRIQMLTEDTLILDSGISIKQQVYAQMYNAYIGDGSAPTHFIANTLVKYGYLMMWVVYCIYLFFFIRILILSDKIIYGSNYAHVVWNLFIFIFLTTFTDLSIANFLRFFLIIINMLFINIMPRVNLKTNFT